MAARPKPARKRPRREKKSRLGLWTTIGLLVILAGYLGALELSRPHVTGDRLRLDTFLRLANDGTVRNVTLLEEDAYYVGDYRRPDGSVARYNAPVPRSYMGKLTADLAFGGTNTSIDQQVKKRVAALATMLLPGLAIILLLVYLVLSSRRGTGLFAIRSGARKMAEKDQSVTFADVGGQESAVAELKEIKEFLADPSRFAAVGAQVPKGILLYGPPGCGKTMLARALAAEAGAAFYSISGSDFVELYVGVGASRVRDLFKEARQNAPALIFIDELDSVGRARGMVGTAQSHGEQEQALNQILAEMDGFSTSDGIMVVAATNRADILDQALLRPGRFDRAIGLEKPDEAARLSILGVHAANKQLDPTVDLAAIASEAIGLTGADLASVMNEGALLAVRAGRSAVSQVDLEEALQRILEAPERHKRLSLRQKSIGRRFTDKDRVSFADVAGQQAAVAELSQIRDFLAHPERFADMGAVIPRGVLLYGPPGCGKTLLARALAGEANAAFFSVTAAEFVEVFVGVGASRVRDLFADARSMAPAIIFIDELDSVGRERAGSGAMQRSNGTDQEQALTQILAEMDEFSPTEGVIVIGATNRPDTLDPALLRPGRFDRTIGLAPPDEADRKAILELHARDKVLDPSVDLADLARRAVGLSGADLFGVLNQAAILAVAADKEAISAVELDEALHRVLRAPADQRALSLRGRSIGRRFAPHERVTFADVAGMDDAVEELGDVREYLADPGRFLRLGARVPRGILLSGAPGCGKTLLARALAGETNAAFFSVGASEFVEVFVGEGASRVRDLFGEARSMAPAIVFIDEVDAIGAHRSWGGTREVEQTLNQILIELDGFEPTTGVIVMAATNRPDMLDAALIRPGRFDRHVAIALPDRAGRRAILELHAKASPLADDVDLGVVAAQTQGFSGADLENVLNEAALLATRRGLAEIPMAVVEEGVERATLGLGSRATVLSEEERRVVAYHESGHALVALNVAGAVPPHKLTIVPRGRTLGHCAIVDTHDRLIHSRSSLMGQMAALLGGTVAEEVVFGETSSAASGDLERVGAIARRMVRSYGMSEALGPVSYGDGNNGAGGSGRSAEAAAIAEAEERRLVNQARDQARGVVVACRAQLDALATALLQRETVSARELSVLAGAPLTIGQEARQPNGMARLDRS